MNLGEVNVERRITQTGPESAGGEIFESVFLSEEETTFQKAVVLEVITDPAAWKNQKNFEKKYNNQNISNWPFLNRVPRNAIIARPVTDGIGTRTSKSEVVLPFFPSHLCFPVKPGETVWIIKPIRNKTKALFCHWMCRVPSWDDVEDANFSHEDRQHHFQAPGEEPSNPIDEIDGNTPLSENAASFEMFGFPNGTSDQRGYTLGQSPNAYCVFSTGSFAYHSFKYEPVPRLTKRPGDLTLQGSNNTSITLGTTGNRIPGGWAADAGEVARIQALALQDPPKRSVSTIPKPESFSAHNSEKNEAIVAESVTYKNNMAPAIDIVAGRGYRIRKDNPISHDSEDQATLPIARGAVTHPPTYPRVKKTITKIGEKVPRSAAMSETSKNPSAFDAAIKDSLVDHAIEGDPDFRYDASRIYAAADGDPDVEFGLAAGDSVALSENLTVPLKSGANIVLKSDNVRIIARKDPDAGVSNPVNGSIRIIKEGAPSAAEGNTEAGGQKAVISLEEDGTIYIEGPKIVIGGRAAENGTGDQIYLGGDPANADEQAAVLGEAFANAILLFAIDICNVVDGVGTGDRIPMFAKGIPDFADYTPPQKMLGNMGTPISAPGMAYAAQQLKINLDKALSKTTRIK